MQEYLKIEESVFGGKYVSFLLNLHKNYVQHVSLQATDLG